MNRICKRIARLAMAAGFALCGAASGQAADSGTGEDGDMMKIRVIAGDQTLMATLDDTRVARDFAALLPLEVTLSDYHATEKVADLPRKLDTTGAPASYAPQPGDITHYAPWGNLAIFYKPFQVSRGLVRLGEFDGSVQPLLRDTDIPVRIELAD